MTPSQVAAGFRSDLDSKVTRCGYPNEYNHEGHVSLWQLSAIRSPSQLAQNPISPISIRMDSIPGYTGFIPGKKSETVIQQTHAAAIRTASEMRPYQAGENPAKKFLTAWDRPSGRRPLQTILAASELRWSGSYAGATTVVKDHEVPPPMRRSFSQIVRTSVEESPTGDSPALAGIARPGYAGYIPGKKAETLFGQTFMRQNRDAMEIRGDARISEAPREQRI